MMLDFFSQRGRRKRGRRDRSPSESELRAEPRRAPTRTANDRSDDVFPGAYGSGVSAHSVAGGGRRERYGNLIEFWIRETAVRLNQLSYDWAFLEPEKNRFNFDAV